MPKYLADNAGLIMNEISDDEADRETRVPYGQPDPRHPYPNHMLGNILSRLQSPAHGIKAQELTSRPLESPFYQINDTHNRFIKTKPFKYESPSNNRFGRPSNWTDSSYPQQQQSFLYKQKPYQEAYTSRNGPIMPDPIMSMMQDGMASSMRAGIPSSMRAGIPTHVRGLASNSTKERLRDDRNSSANELLPALDRINTEIALLMNRVQESTRRTDQFRSMEPREYDPREYDRYPSSPAPEKTFFSHQTQIPGQNSPVRYNCFC